MCWRTNHLLERAYSSGSSHDSCVYVGDGSSDERARFFCREGNAFVVDDRGIHEAFQKPAIVPRLGANQRREIALRLAKYDLIHDASLRVQYKSMNHEGVDRAVATRVSQFSLRIEEHPAPTQHSSNPYVVTGAVQTRDRIYGRDKDLDTVWSTLVGRHQDTAVLVSGERRIGKSTLLNAMEQVERFRGRYSIYEERPRNCRRVFPFA